MRKSVKRYGCENFLRQKAVFSFRFMTVKLGNKSYSPAGPFLSRQNKSRFRSNQVPIAQYDHPLRLLRGLRGPSWLPVRRPRGPFFLKKIVFCFAQIQFHGWIKFLEKNLKINLELENDLNLILISLFINSRLVIIYIREKLDGLV